MKPGRTAICISGLPRTGIQAHGCFRKLFSSIDNYDVFYHTWNEPNTEVSFAKLNNLYSPVISRVDPPAPVIPYASFGSMLYSMMIANELKKTYEIQNNFRYDLVIKTRFDLVVRPNNLFPILPITPRTIYCPGGNNGIGYTDYEHHGISDLLFWGDSAAMDVATTQYMHYIYRCLEINKYILLGHKIDPHEAHFSAGTIIYNRCVSRNIAVVKYACHLGELPWRTDVSHLDPETDYEKIKERVQNEKK
jgi:hypothetical protein